MTMGVDNEEFHDINSNIFTKYDTNKLSDKNKF